MSVARLVDRVHAHLLDDPDADAGDLVVRFAPLTSAAVHSRAALARIARAFERCAATAESSREMTSGNTWSEWARASFAYLERGLRWRKEVAADLLAIQPERMPPRRAEYEALVQAGPIGFDAEGHSQAKRLWSCARPASPAATRNIFEVTAAALKDVPSACFKTSSLTIDCGIASKVVPGSSSRPEP